MAKLCQFCDIYQWLVPIYKSDKGPLRLIITFEPFMKWGVSNNPIVMCHGIQAWLIKLITSGRMP